MILGDQEGIPPRSWISSTGQVPPHHCHFRIQYRIVAIFSCSPSGCFVELRNIYCYAGTSIIWRPSSPSSWSSSIPSSRLRHLRRPGVLDGGGVYGIRPAEPAAGSVQYSGHGGSIDSDRLPASLFDVSFQLSFVAVASLLVLMPRLTTLLPVSLAEAYLDQVFTPQSPSLETRGAGDPDLHLVTLSATVGTLPLILFYFNRLSVVSLIANFIVVQSWNPGNPPLPAGGSGGSALCSSC